MKKRYLVYLGYLLLLTLALTAVSMSQFRTTVQSSGQVSVARPVLRYVPVSLTLNGTTVEGSGNEISLSNLKPGDTLVYQFNINNFEGSLKNQVKLQYRVSVTSSPTETALPLTYTLNPGGGAWTSLGFGSDITHAYTLTVNWPEGATGDYANKAQTIQIRIDSEQADN